MSVKAECPYCGAIFNEDDSFIGEDGCEMFCSEDCRRQHEQDIGIARAESRYDLD